MKLQISDQNNQMDLLLKSKQDLEMNLRETKSTNNARDLQKLSNLENQIRILNGDINATKSIISEKNMLVEEKNKTIEHLTSQNQNSSNSYELFQTRFNEMESKIFI